MADSGDHHQNPHAIFVAYPLQGHVIPAVQLAIKLASRGFTVTFLNTHSVHHQISRARRNAAAAADDIFSAVREQGLDIRYATLSDGLPLSFDRSLHHDQFMAALLHVFSAHVEEAVARIVGSPDGGRVRFLVADTFFVWPSAVARKFGLVYVSFWTEPALVFSLYYHMDLLRINGHFGCQDCRDDPIDYIPGVKSIDPKDMTSYLQETDTSSVCHQIIFSCFRDAKSADFVICNTVEELELETVSALRAEKPFYNIGPLVPDRLSRGAVATSLWAESDCTQWLDARAEGSVLYVSFGSYAHVSRSDLVEIAHGLVLSGAHFVWVLRPDIVSSEESDPLPPGYKDSLGGRSIIVPWCNQYEVLAHPAIGGFLTHCGWNSIIESMWNGVPLICFPLLTDQFTNRKLAVDDWKVGINLTDGTRITRGEVAQKVNRLMSGKSGSQLRVNTGEVRKKLEGALMPGAGSSSRSMDQFVKDLTAKIDRQRRAAMPDCNGY